MYVLIISSKDEVLKVVTGENPEFLKQIANNPKFAPDAGKMLIIDEGPCDPSGSKRDKIWFEKTIGDQADSPEVLAQKVLRMVNLLSGEPKGFLNTVYNDHPTLQQSFTRLCLAWIYKLAGSTYYDGRNQAAVERSKLIVNFLGPYGKDLPLI
jgi:hypothetical protein